MSLLSRLSLLIIGFLKKMAVFIKSQNVMFEYLPQDFSAIFWESLWIDPDKPFTVLHFPCLFLFTAVNTIIPSRDLFKRCMLWAISIQRVYKVTTLMDLWKEVVFFSGCVGGGSEASCLSSFNWFSVAIGAGLFFFRPWKCSTSERTVWIHIYKKVSGELSRILRLSSLPLDDSQLTLQNM